MKVEISDSMVLEMIYEALINEAVRIEDLGRRGAALSDDNMRIQIFRQVVRDRKLTLTPEVLAPEATCRAIIAGYVSRNESFKKFHMIRDTREATGMGLKDSKEMVEKVGAEMGVNFDRP